MLTVREAGDIIWGGLGRHGARTGAPLWYPEMWQQPGGGCRGSRHGAQEGRH